jgi:F-type H+-transporting ATPase subunit delta
VSASAIASRYAKALVQLGAEENAVDRFHGELSGIVQVLKAHPELSALLASPAYGIEEKRGILEDVAGRLAVAPTIRNFLLLLLERSRIGCLQQIVVSYSLLADERSGVVRPTVTSALPLEEAQVAGIRKALEDSTGKQVVLAVEVDPSLIGGVVTKVGGTVYDGSVRTQLSRIEDTLQKG